MNRILCIVGPTGTGKTNRAIEISKQQPSILVSADSRQVYRGMDIVTGKDHPTNLIIHGIDLVNPDEQCSVSIWYDSVMPHISTAWKEGKLPIIVGGTGLYVKSITDGIETIRIPINQNLRNELGALSISELQNRLTRENFEKFNSMNHSDQNNPRRLIRAIEISESDITISPLTKDLSSNIIGFMYYDNSNYRSKVKDRVISRLKNGAIDETRSLLKKYDKKIQSISAIGYKSIIKYLEKQCTQEQMIEEWIAGELSYAKRQMTWFRKQPVIWYDIENNKE